MTATAEANFATVAGYEVATDHWIGGERVASAERFDVITPIDGSVIARVSAGGRDEADLAVRAAHAASPGWAALGAAGRGELLNRLADLIDDNVERLAAVECADMAMLLESLRLRVIHRAAANFRNYADLALAYEERDWHSKGTWNRVQRMPAGPAAVITPWNAPFMLSTWKVAPALAAGCPVVLKPAEWSPLSCSLLADLTAEAGFPPGVFNVLQGVGEQVGAALVSHPLLRRISFTGSPETARHIGVSAARNLVPFTGELGGKGPLIVFDDADLDAAAAKAAGQYDDAGQVCLAGTRLLVQESIREPFLERFNAAVDKHVLGDPRQAQTTVSPLIHPDHLERVDGFVQRAVAQGNRLVRGGRRLRGPALRADAVRAERQRRGDRAARGVRPRADVPDLCRRARGDRARQLDASMASRGSSTRARWAAPTASAVPSAPASSGSTRSWCATSRPRSAASASPGSAARVATTRSTSTRI